MGAHPPGAALAVHPMTDDPQSPDCLYGSGSIAWLGWLVFPLRWWARLRAWWLGITFQDVIPDWFD